MISICRGNTKVETTRFNQDDISRNSVIRTVRAATVHFYRLTKLHENVLDRKTQERKAVEKIKSRSCSRSRISSAIGDVAVRNKSCDQLPLLSRSAFISSPFGYHGDSEDNARQIRVAARTKHVSFSRNIRDCYLRRSDVSIARASG